MAADNHNSLAPELVKRICRETAGESAAMVVLESVVLGVLLFHRQDPREAAVFLDVLTERVVERLGPTAARIQR